MFVVKSSRYDVKQCKPIIRCLCLEPVGGTTSVVQRLSDRGIGSVLRVSPFVWSQELCKFGRIQVVNLNFSTELCVFFLLWFCFLVHVTCGFFKEILSKLF